MFTGAAKHLRAIFLVGFILTMALSITSYVDSSFLGTFIDIKSVGLLFSAGSILAIALLSFLPRILPRIGVSGIFHLNSMIYLLGIMLMLHTNTTALFIIAFIFYIASGVSIYFSIDLLIEHYSKKKSTGNIRGFYLTVYNFAFLVGPLLAGIILKNNSFELVYLIAGVFIVLMTLIYIRDLENIKFEYKSVRVSFWKNVKKLLKDKNLSKTYFTSLMLSFFFSWMAIYTPIYLNKFIKFDWGQIGMLFALMHLPYVLLELPIGRWADKYKCEKELMSIGLVIIGISTALIAQINTNSFALWTIILMFTRVGASFVQVATESYFFKKVDEKDSSLIALYRDAAPTAYIIGPLLGTLALSFVSYRELFIILGAVMILAVLKSVRVKNIK